MKVTSAIVGTVLLTTSLGLSYLSNSSATQMIAKKDAIIMKYIDDSNSALESGDIKGALKFAKLAIAVDPKDKKGFKAYENIMEVKYKPSEDYTEDTSTNKQPSVEEEEEEDMGC